MIPEEGDQSSSAMTSLMSNEKRKLTLANVDQNRASSRLPSGSKRYSEPTVGGAIGSQNPWDDSKRVSLSEAGNRKSSNLPGSLKEVGKGLNRKLIKYATNN